MGDCAVTLRLGIAKAALSGDGHGKVVATGRVVVVDEPGRVVVLVAPGRVDVVDVVDVIEVVVVEPELVADVTRRSGRVRAVPSEMTSRTLNRSDLRGDPFMVPEINGTSATFV